MVTAVLKGQHLLQRKGFGWKEEDLKWLGMKFFPRGKVKKKDPSMEARETDPQPSWKGRTMNKRLLGRAEQGETISGVLGSPVVNRCKGRLRKSKLCVITITLR